MNTQLTAEKIENLISKSLKDSIGSSVVKVNKNVYKLFGLYTVIVVDENTVKVKKRGRTIDCFSSLKTAVSWCTANHVGDSVLATNIVKLDRDKTRLQNDILFSIELMNRKTTNQDIVSVKVDYKKQILYRIVGDLKNCISKAKYMQTKEFDNEIERFRHVN